MTEAVLADAETPVLNEVTRPALVHFDLWPGNLLVTGDPVADFVSLVLFGDIERDGDSLAGYAEARGECVATPDGGERRLVSCPTRPGSDG